MHFRKNLPLFLLCFCLSLSGLQQAQAQDPITAVIKAGVTKAIVAVDLQVQRLQNKTIWLQNAQKVLENKLSALKLAEISDWSEQQQQLYAGYYAELWQVKAAISYHQRVGDLVRNQAALVAAYKRAYSLFRQDANFSAEELDYMHRVYAGILAESGKHLDQALLVLQSFSTRMGDGQRLALLDQAAGSIAQNYSHLRAFNAQNLRLSLRRAKEKGDLQAVRQLYGLYSPAL